MNSIKDHDHVADDYQDTCGCSALRVFWNAAQSLVLVLIALFILGVCVMMTACQASSRIDGGKASLEATTVQEEPTTTETRESLRITPPAPSEQPETEATQWRIVIHPPPEKPK